MALDLWNLEEQKIDGDLNNYSMNLFGADGSGKTSLMYAIRRKLGSTVIWGYEDRFKGVPNIRVVEMKSWKEHLNYVKALKKGLKEGKKLPFENIIMDTVGEAYVMCQDAVMEENEWETMSGDRGARYPVVGKAFMDSVRELKHMGIIVNFVSHDKVVKVSDEVDKINPDTANQIKHLVMGGIDIIAYLEKVVIEDDDGEIKEVRRLWLTGHPIYKLKTPLYGFPKYIEYETVDEGAEKFIASFNHAVEVTRQMADEGKDISNPNEENEMEIEYIEPTMPSADENKVDDIEDEIESDDLPEEFNEVDIETLRKKALEVRDKLRDKLDDNEVRKILKESLGTVKIKTYEDAEKLSAFINKYE